MEDFAKSYVDVETQTINYNIEVPEGLAVKYRESYGKPKIVVISNYGYGTIGYSVYFAKDSGTPIFERDIENQEELNKSTKIMQIIICVSISIIWALIVVMIFVIRNFIESIKEAKRIKKSYLATGKML